MRKKINWYMYHQLHNDTKKKYPVIFTKCTNGSMGEDVVACFCSPSLGTYKFVSFEVSHHRKWFPSNMQS